MRFHRPTRAAAALLCAALAACSDSLDPGDPAYEIVYVQAVGGLYPGELRVRTLDGRSRTLWNATDVVDPAWSRDGRHVAFVALTSMSARDLVVLRADGTLESRRPAAPDVRAFDWSPDGAPRIAGFDADVPQAITILGLDGSDPAIVMERNMAGDLGVRWSPDADSLLVTRNNGVRPFDLDLWLVAADGSGARRVATNARSGAFAPDGVRIAFFERIESPEPGSALPPENLVVANRDGTGRRVVAARVNGWTPRWSPDGRRIVYSALRPGASEITEDLWVVASAGGTPVNLTRNPVGNSSRMPDWRPAR